MSNECVEALADFDIHPRSMALFMKKLFFLREVELDKKDDEGAFEGRRKQQVKSRKESKESKESQLGVESMFIFCVPRCPAALTLSDDSKVGYFKSVAY